MPQRRTVLITGASSGIGYALAKRFSKEGYAIVAVARDAKRLDVLAAECPHVFPIIQDLSEPAAVTTIMGTLQQKKINVDILVNNAGFGLWGHFAEIDISQTLKMIDVHIRALLELTHALLPNMLEKKSGAILNVGSIYCFTPVAYQSIYAATKAFLYSFSESLSDECRPHNVSVSLLCPGSTTTAFRTRAHVTKKPGFLDMSADRVAEFAYRGLVRRKKIIIPGFLNWCYVRFVRFLPKPLIYFLIYNIRGLKP